MPKLNTRLKGTGLASAAPAARAEGSVARPAQDLFFSPLPSPEHHRRFPAQTAVRSPASKSAAGTSPGAVTPLTIFYNGAVITFNLPRDKAEAVIDLAESTTSVVRRIERRADAFVDGSGRQQQPPQPFSVDKLDGDLPLARKRSLQRFLEKRKERLRPDPYACTPH